MTEQRLSIRESIAISPSEVASNAAEQAKVLMDIVNKTKCYQTIAGKQYLQVEAWETIGAFNRVHAVTEWIEQITRDGILVGYDAKVNLIDANGNVVGSAIMPCYFTENACKGKEGDAKDKACKSAAQTFATSKAYRMNYSYVAILAGYQPTPAEEMGTTTTEEPTTRHYCSIHKTVFFKKGKMKGYSHKIGDTNEWCNEEDQQESSPEATSTARKPPEGKTESPVLVTGETLVKLEKTIADKGYTKKEANGIMINILKWPQITGWSKLTEDQAIYLIEYLEKNPKPRELKPDEIPF